MAIKSDPQGFLVGELIKTQDQLLTSQHDGVRILGRIRSDVAAIARALSVQSKTQARNTRTGPGGMRSAPTASTSTRSGGNTVGGNRTASAAATSVRRSSVTVAVATRDNRGRFLPRATVDDKVREQGATGPRTPDGRFTGKGDGAGIASIGGGLSRLSDGMGRLSASLANADNLDPTVNAMKEVTDVVTPLGRGLFSMFGRSAERKKERWYNRIWTAIKDKKPGAQQAVGGGGGGLFGGAAGGLLGGAGRGLMGGAAGLLKGGGKLLKRIPLLGALIGGGLALGSAFGMDDDPTKTPEENRARRYKGVGEGAGMMIGGAAGAVLGSVLGPVGTVVGGYLGGLLGDKVGGAVGEWTKELMDSDLPGRIEAGWNTFTVGLSAAWESITADAKAGWGTVTANATEWWTTTKDAASKIMDSVSGAATAANDWIKQKTGFDAKGAAGSVWEGAKASAGTAWNAYKDAAGKTLDFAKENLVPATVKRAITAGSNAATQAKAGYDEQRGTPNDAPAPRGGLQTASRSAGGMVGKVADRWNGGAKADIVGAAKTAGVDAGLLAQIAHFESGFNKDAAPIQNGKALSSAHGYGQFLDGTWTDMVNKHGGKYGVANAGKLSKSDALALRGDTTLQAGMLAEYTKENASKGRALGGADDAANVYALHNLGGGDGAKLLNALKTNPDAAVSSILSGKVVSNNKSLYGDGSISVREAYSRMGDKMRAGDAYAKEARAAQIAPVTAGLPAPTSASIPAAVPAQLPDAAKNEVPAANTPGGSSGAKVQVSLKEKTSQNIGDRGIAHIVTGGIGAT